MTDLEARAGPPRTTPHDSLEPGDVAPTLHDWVTLLRPRQWVKNGFVLAPLLFGGRVTDPSHVTVAALAAVLFSALASGVYALNDAIDVERDRMHPRKRRRPIAAGRIAVRSATALGLALASAAIVGAWLLDPWFGAIALTYLAVNGLYTFGLKAVVIVDVFAIASFFLMRLLAGAVVVDVVPSIWLLLCGGLLALYLGFAKRRNELLTLGDTSSSHREVLTKYSSPFLDQMSSVLLSVTVVSYIMYTLSSETATRVGSDLLSYSVVFVLYGVFRYLYLSHRRQEGGDPAELLLTDAPLMASVVLWSAYCGWVIYVSG